jgi:hypothetical protein
VRQEKRPPDGPDISATEEFVQVPNDEITDPRAWLEEKYRHLALTERGGQ